MVPRLLEMGFRSLSIAPSLIPTTKALIRTIRLETATNGPKQPGGNMTCEHAANVIDMRAQAEMPNSRRTDTPR
jgi:phosphoenolpyruvate-protein kinase (PTS system EI component)